MSVLDNALRQIWTHGLKIVELWKNASPASTFGEQTILIPDIEKYQLCLIGHCVTNTLNRISTNIVPLNVPEDFTPQLIYGAYTGTSSSSINARGASGFRTVSKTNNGLIFSVSRITKADGAVSTQVDNTTCIPYVIYGIQLLGGVLLKIKAVLTAPLCRKEVLPCL